MRRCDDNGLITVYTVIAGLLCVYYYCTQIIIDALYPGISFVLCFRVFFFFYLCARSFKEHILDEEYRVVTLDEANLMRLLGHCIFSKLKQLDIY